MVVNNANTFLPGTPQVPNALLITAITKSYPMVVSVNLSNLYVVGQLVRLNIPPAYGMFQANQLTGQIISINNLNLSLDIDSSGFDTFSIPSNPPPYRKTEPASLAPAGSKNLVYDNFSKYVPFQSLTNEGN